MVLIVEETTEDEEEEATLELILVVVEEITDDETEEVTDELILLDAEADAEEEAEEEVEEAMDELILLVAEADAEEEAEEEVEEEAEEATDEVILVVAEEVTEDEILVLVVVEAAALVDDIEEETLDVDEAADEATAEDELLRDEDVDEYTVDDGDVEETFVVEAAEGIVDEAVEDKTVDDESVEELMRIGFAPVPGAWYISSLFEPPQNSDELPLQGMLHPVKPSGAGPPPPVKEFPQSLESISHNSRTVNEERDTHSTHLHIPHQRTTCCSAHTQLRIEPLSLTRPLQSSHTQSRVYESIDPCNPFRVSGVDGKNSAGGKRICGLLTYSIQLASNRLVLDPARVL